jgi:hypothetical protein
VLCEKPMTRSREDARALVEPRVVGRWDLLPKSNSSNQHGYAGARVSS